MAGLVFLTTLLTYLLSNLRPVTSLRPPKPKPVRMPNTDQPYFHFAPHHKAGTALINHMCDHVLKTVGGDENLCARCTHIINISEAGTWCWRIWSNGLQKKSWPEFYNNSVHYFTGTSLTQVAKAGDKANYRAVHIVRDPLTTFASAYIYDQKGVDHRGAGKEELGALSLKEGLKLKALDIKKLMNEMLQAHQVAMKYPQKILEVRFEDFKSDYDATASKVFNFIAGAGHEDLLPSFLSRAAKDDQNRWHKGRFNQIHVSQPEYESKVVAALRELCAEGNEAVTQALAPRVGLGYGEKCPGPEAP